MGSAKSIARLAGLFWLLFVAATAFSMGYARSILIVPGDGAATIERISSLDGLYRASIAVTLLSQILMFLLGLALFHLFHRASRIWAVTLLASVSISVAIAVACAVANYAVLDIVSRPDYRSAFGPEQIGALAMIWLRLVNSAQGLLEIFWTPFYIAFGMLVLRSRMLPAILGLLLTIMGAGYLINVFTKLLMPAFHPELFTQVAILLGALGGIPTILWLLVMGAKEHRAADDPTAQPRRSGSP